MSDHETPVGSEELQFDRVITGSTSSALPSKVAVICGGCQTSIETETYVSIALAYTPIAVTGAIDAARKAQKASATTTSSRGAVVATDSFRAAPPKPSGGRLLAFVFLLALIGALPVLVVLGSLPFGLISAFIIFIGMRQAWRMTGAPWLQILGPYRVGAATAPA